MEFENLPEGWRKDKLINLTTKIGSGATPKGGSDVYLENGEIALIRSQNIYNLSFSPDGLAYIEQHQANKLANVEVRKDDVLLNITGDSVARACLVPDSYLPARVNQHVAILRTDSEKLNARYLQYFLVNPAMQMHMLNLSSAGATRKALTKEMIEDFTIPIPPLPQQQKIASILGALDDKIELNNQMNQTLETMAKTLFKSWFVDFEPFADGEFEESELGMIPKGWQVQRLDDVVNIKYGKNLPTTKLVDQGFPVFGGNGQIGFYTEYLYAEPQVLISCRGNASGKVNWSLPKSFITNNSLVLEYEKGPLNFSFVKAYSEFYEFYEYKTGTAQPQITIDSIKAHRTIVPDDETLKSFNKIYYSFFSKSLQIFEENTQLSVIRDTLLPKLMSGEIEV